MLTIDKLLYKSAQEHGRGTEYTSEVSRLRNKYPNKALELIHREAYETVMNT